MPDQRQVSASGWAYPHEPLQRPLRAIFIFILLFAVFVLLQVVMALLVFHFIFGGSLIELGNTYAHAGRTGTEISLDSALMSNFLKAMVVGMTPAGALAALLAWWLSRFGLPRGQGRLPLGPSRLGPWRWILLMVGFIIAMGLIFNLIFWALGIDPSSYETSSKGLSDAHSKAGIVEKTLAELAHDPKLFVLALPGVVIGAPLAEEFIFRGGLFAGLRNSIVGAPGAVVITAALWALAHGQSAPWMFIGVLFVMGLVLGVMLLRFGTLRVTIVAHALWNTISSLMMFVSGSQG